MDDIVQQKAELARVAVLHTHTHIGVRWQQIRSYCISCSLHANMLAKHQVDHKSKGSASI